MVDPIMLVAFNDLDLDIAATVGAAVSSAAVRVLNQVPPVQQLQKELSSVKSALTSTVLFLRQFYRML
jgi:hypothetical protein